MAVDWTAPLSKKFILHTRKIYDRVLILLFFRRYRLEFCTVGRRCTIISLAKTNLNELLQACHDLLQVRQHPCVSFCIRNIMTWAWPLYTVGMCRFPPPYRATLQAELEVWALHLRARNPPGNVRPHSVIRLRLGAEVSIGL